MYCLGVAGRPLTCHNRILGRVCELNVLRYSDTPTFLDTVAVEQILSCTDPGQGLVATAAEEPTFTTGKRAHAKIHLCSTAIDPSRVFHDA